MSSQIIKPSIKFHFHENLIIYYYIYLYQKYERRYK